MNSLLKHSEDILLVENQPSIRILMEWITIRIFLSNKFDDNLLWKKLDNVIKTS